MSAIHIPATHVHKINQIHLFISKIQLNLSINTPTLCFGRWRDQISIVDKPHDEVVVGITTLFYFIFSFLIILMTN